jgi:hypothetical protein
MPENTSTRQPLLQAKTNHMNTISRQAPIPFVVPTDLDDTNRRKPTDDKSKNVKSTSRPSINPPVVNPNHETLKKLYDIQSYEMKKLQKLFNEYAGVDRNMNFQEFVRLYGSINPGLRGPDIVNIAEEAFLASDTNDDGLLNFDEFLIAYCLTKPGRSFVGFPDLFKPKTNNTTTPSHNNNNEQYGTCRATNMLPYYPQSSSQQQPETATNEIEINQNVISNPEPQSPVPEPVITPPIQTVPVEKSSLPAVDSEYQVTPYQVPDYYPQPFAMPYPPPPQYYMHPTAYPYYPGAMYPPPPPPPPHHYYPQIPVPNLVPSESNENYSKHQAAAAASAADYDAHREHYDYTKNLRNPHYPPSEANASDYSYTESQRSRAQNSDQNYYNPNNNNNNQNNPDSYTKFDLSQLPPIDTLTHKLRHKEFKNKITDNDYDHHYAARKPHRIVDDHPPLFSKSELKNPSLTVKTASPVRRSNLSRRRTRC